MWCAVVQQASEVASNQVISHRFQPVDNATYCEQCPVIRHRLPVSIVATGSTGPAPSRCELSLPCLCCGAGCVKQDVRNGFDMLSLIRHVQVSNSPSPSHLIFSILCKFSVMDQLDGFSIFTCHFRCICSILEQITKTRSNVFAAMSVILNKRMAAS